MDSDSVNTCIGTSVNFIVRNSVWCFGSGRSNESSEQVSQSESCSEPSETLGNRESVIPDGNKLVDVGCKGVESVLGLKLGLKILGLKKFKKVKIFKRFSVTSKTNTGAPIESVPSNKGIEAELA